MTFNVLTRRNLLTSGTCALVGALGIVSTGHLFAEERDGKRSSPNEEEVIRTLYSGFDKKDWNVTDSVLADGFTFTSPNGDDHIPKSLYKQRCFVSQLPFIERFDLEAILIGENEAFVKYVCHRTDGTSFRNTDYIRLASGKIAAIECYFGGKAGYASAPGTVHH